MLRAAFVMLAAFVALSLAGARAEVSVLSGTATTAFHAVLGLAYAVAYFAVVLLGPPLLVAGSYRLFTRTRRSARPS